MPKIEDCGELGDLPSAPFSHRNGYLIERASYLRCKRESNMPDQWIDGDDAANIPRSNQQCCCPRCGKPFDAAMADTLTTPHHENAGRPCPGAGKVLRLVSAGMSAFSQAQWNGKVLK